MDGYNLIHAAPLLSPHREVSLQAGRQALERSLKRYARRRRARVHLFYDGGGGGADPGQGTGLLQIRFSHAPESADDLLKREIQRLHGARYARVVTSDREILRHARRHKLATVTAAEFARELEEPPPAAGAAAEAPPRELDPHLVLDPEEVDRWEQLFRQRPADSDRCD